MQRSTCGDLDFSIKCDGDHEMFLVKVWKLTGANQVYSSQLSAERLNNRSWRLLNEVVLLGHEKNISEVITSLSDFDISTRPTARKASGQSSPDPNTSKSLNEVNSRSTLFSHCSKLSLNCTIRRTSARNSLISEEAYGGSEEGIKNESSGPNKDIEDGVGRNDTAHRSMFYFGNSPTDKKEEEEINDKRGSVASLTDEHPIINQAQRHDSLFSGLHSSSSVPDDQISITSSTDISEEGEISDDEIVEKPRSRKASAKDDDSDWLSVTSEEEEEEELKPRERPLIFDKRNLTKKTQGSTPKGVEGSPVASYLMNMIKQKSLLSLMLVNNSNGSHMTADKMAKKPALKRAFTTGIITVEEPKLRQGSDNIHKSPSILLTERGNASSVHRIGCDGKTTSSPSMNPASSNEEVDDALLGKRKSMVGISSVSVNRKDTSRNNNVEDANSGVKVSGSHQSLSSSLNKYSGTQSQYSLSNVLSKSSLGLTSLLNSRGKVSRKGTNSSVKGFSKSPSLDTKASTSSVSGLVQKDDSIKSLERTGEEYDSKAYNDREVEQESEQEYLFKPKPNSKNLTSSKPMTLKKPTSNQEFSKSLKESIDIDQKLGKVPRPERVFDDKSLVDPNIDNFDDYHSKGW